MPPDILTNFFAQLTAQGPLFVGLALAIYYFKKSDDRKAEINEKLIQAMNQERVERIDGLEKHVVECNERHAAAQLKYEALLLRVANLDHKRPG